MWTNPTDKGIAADIEQWKTRLFLSWRFVMLQKQIKHANE